MIEAIKSLFRTHPPTPSEGVSQSEALALLETHFEPYKQALKLGHWDIKVTFTELPGTTDAENRYNTHYNESNIAIDLSKMTDGNYFLHTLRHELYHLLHAPFTATISGMERVLSDREYELLRSRYDYECEQFVVNLELIFRGKLFDIS